MLPKETHDEGYADEAGEDIGGGLRYLDAEKFKCGHADQKHRNGDGAGAQQG